MFLFNRPQDTGSWLYDMFMCLHLSHIFSGSVDLRIFSFYDLCAQWLVNPHCHSKAPLSDSAPSSKLSGYWLNFLRISSPVKTWKRLRQFARVPWWLLRDERYVKNDPRMPLSDTADRWWNCDPVIASFPGLMTSAGMLKSSSSRRPRCFSTKKTHAAWSQEPSPWQKWHSVTQAPRIGAVWVGSITNSIRGDIRYPAQKKNHGKKITWLDMIGQECMNPWKPSSQNSLPSLNS